MDILEEDERITIAVFGNLLAYQFFQVHFLLFLTFYVILGINICLTQSGDLVINKLFFKY